MSSDQLQIALAAWIVTPDFIRPMAFPQWLPALTQALS